MALESESDRFSLDYSLRDSRVSTGEEKPKWVEGLTDKGWDILTDRKVEGRQLYRIAAFNPNLGKNGVTMSVIEKPDSIGDMPGNLDTWEVKFDDYDQETDQDLYSVTLLDLETATGIPQPQLAELLTTKDFWEEMGEKYAQKFLGFTSKDVDTDILFTDPDGVESLTNLIFSDLVEEIQKKSGF